MKDAEDEAFEAIEKAQGWRKRQIAEQKGDPVTKDEALKLALEALEVIYDRAVFDYSLPADHFAAEGAQEAITAIKEVLAQPEQERNFCSRCGKRLGKNDWDVHTCTPPRGKE